MGRRECKMNEFQAAMGLCNLHHLDQEIDRRRLVVERYLSGLAGVPGIRLPSFREGLRPIMPTSLCCLRTLKLTGIRYTTAWQGTEYTRENIFIP